MAGNDDEEQGSKGVSRRALFTSLFGGVRDVVADPGAPHASRVQQELLPNAESARQDARAVHAFGLRLSGSTAHADMVEWMREEMARAGCYERSVDEDPVTTWTPHEWGLSILDGAELGAVPVASPRARSGGFNPDGSPSIAPIVASLVDLGTAPPFEASPFEVLSGTNPYQASFEDWFRSQVAARAGSIEGTIAIIELPPVPIFHQGEIGALAGCYYVQAPDHMTWPLWNQQRTWRKVWTSPNPEPPAPLTNGPAALVYVVDASFEELAGQLLPMHGAASTTPVLLVDREAGARIRRAATAGARARFVLSASRGSARAPSIVFKLPGAQESRLQRRKRHDVDDRLADEVEYIFAGAKTDGAGIAQGAGARALVAIARYLGARARQGKQLHRTVVFAATAGAISAERLPSLGERLAALPRIAARTAFGMSIENLGCAETGADESGVRATGVEEPAVVYHHPALTPLVYDAYIGRALLNHGVSRGEAGYFGGGRALAAALPAVSLAAGPSYLAQASPDLRSAGGFEHLNEPLFIRQLDLLLDLLIGLDGLPRDPFQA